MWNGQGEVMTRITEMLNMHLILSIEQRELKGASSYEKNLTVFKGEEYDTSLFFFLKGRKGEMELRGVGGSVCQTNTYHLWSSFVRWSRMWTIGLSLAVTLCFRYLEGDYIAGWCLGRVSEYKFSFQFTANDDDHRFSTLVCTSSVPESSNAAKPEL